MTRRDPAAPGDDARASDHDPSDPRRIDLLAVTEADVVDALEAAARSDRDIVLRVTPPFSGRMRARLHDAGAVDAGPSRASDDTSDASALHVPPERFVADSPAYPTVDDTEDELRASPEPYTKERHRERHRTAIEAWRAAVRERLVESVTIPALDGDATVSVAYLG